MDSRNKPDLNGKSPFPDNLKENPFRVPEGYFESFHERLIEKLEDKSRPGSVPLYHISRKVILAAAVVVLLISIGSVLLMRYYHKPEPAELPYFALTLNDLEEAFGMERFDEYTVVSFFLENTDEVSFQEEVKIMDELSSDSNITNEDIEEYLIENNELENLLLDL